MAYFLLEIPDEGKNTVQAKKWPGADGSKGDQRWSLYTDGVASKEGSGAGLILTSPAGYEALLAGLQLIKQIGAEVVLALTESRLAAN